ncbi:hypothetical protein QA612_14015 [Evansella sp. AB-P1]|uniref:hypothetical protein n=1 Tax=Evansella sp. AB-P1 TaxID=3037653 RepID=UPI00241E64D9|nr:hypothetical protein [Evansella sp. AB-P1]MDG5788597.1 hypothetical protein [Evansella sp. AB-P1]
MTNPVSIFIMDVSDSTSKNNWEEISTYLDELEDWINTFVCPVAKSIVKHRRGDEIIFIGEHYVTAYTVANVINHIWKYPQQSPYFGITFGNIEKSIASIDIETWNHPLIKKAREANERIKYSNEKLSVLFYLDNDYIVDNKVVNSNVPHNETENLFNLLMEMEYNLRKNQTELQKLICDLHFIYEKQNVVANLVKKSPATISSHFKKGNSKLILKTVAQVQQTINSYEKFGNDKELSHFTKALVKSMKINIGENLPNFINVERNS